MTLSGQVVLRGLEIAAQIGTYGPGDVRPDTHLLDLTLDISPHRVLIPEDEMALVFDYDPLVADIDQIARACHYQTQERLVSLIAGACAAYLDIESLDMCLRKRPVLGQSGSLGIRLVLSREALTCLRETLC